MVNSFRNIGQSIPRSDGLGKLTGTARYAGDISFPGMLHLKLFRSDHAHARIRKIHTGKAAALPGVVAVLTHQDIPGVPSVGFIIKDQPVLCKDRVRYIGDPVVLVVAQSLEVAKRAVSLIHVDYEDLPALFSPEEALAPDAIQIHEKGNLLFEQTLLKGDPDRGLRDSDRVITHTYRTGLVEHAYLEPEAGVADLEQDKVTVWMPSRYPHYDHREITGVLGLLPEKVRLIDTPIGGCFGDKASLNPGYYAALATLKTKKPCKLVYTREESFMVTMKRHPFTIHYTTGATKEGLLVAVKVDLIADSGAYASHTAAVIQKSMIHATGPYEIPNVWVRGRGVYTNNPVAGAMRGFGVPQVAVAHESQIDMLSESLGIGPLEIRRKNGLKPGSLTATGQRLNGSVGLEQTIVEIEREILRKKTPMSSGSKRYGWGVASMFYSIGGATAFTPGVARIKAEVSGNFVLYVGCSDVGQGSNTILRQIAAEVLECRMDQINLIAGDTELCPDSGPTVASRVTYAVGRSVQIAAERLKDLLWQTAGSIMTVPLRDLTFDGDFFYVAAPYGRTSLQDAVRRLKEKGVSAVSEALFYPGLTPLDPKTTQGSSVATYAYATQAAFVSVDMDSGESTVICILASHDVGRAINPASVTGQIEGAVAMGLGYALTEEIPLKNGCIQNPSFSEYFIPTALDVPEIMASFVECEEPSGPFGAKGVGEPAMIPTAPAILNAIHAAAGIRLTELPAKPEAVRRLLNVASASRKQDL
jgi:nicotinate dehydrogenase large molybdopterin subunit